MNNEKKLLAQELKKRLQQEKEAFFLPPPTSESKQAWIRPPETVPSKAPDGMGHLFQEIVDPYPFCMILAKRGSDVFFLEKIQQAICDKLSTATIVWIDKTTDIVGLLNLKQPHLFIAQTSLISSWIHAPCHTVTALSSSIHLIVLKENYTTVEDRKELWNLLKQTLNSTQKSS